MDPPLRLLLEINLPPTHFGTRSPLSSTTLWHRVLSSLARPRRPVPAGDAKAAEFRWSSTRWSRPGTEWSRVGTVEEAVRNRRGAEWSHVGTDEEPARNLLGTDEEPSGLMSEPMRIPYGSHTCDFGTDTDPTRIRFVDFGSPTDPTHPLFYYNTK